MQLQNSNFSHFTILKNSNIYPRILKVTIQPISKILRIRIKFNGICILSRIEKSNKNKKIKRWKGSTWKITNETKTGPKYYGI